MNRKKRICILRMASAEGDPRILKEVSALLESGYLVDIIGLKEKGVKFFETSGNLRYFRIPLLQQRGSLSSYIYMYTVGFLSMMLMLNILSIRYRYKMIQVNTMPDFLAFTTWIQKIAGAKIIIDFHEPSPELFITKFGTNKYKCIHKLMILIEQKALKYSHKSFTVSEALRLKYIERGANPDKITVIPNVCNEKYFYPEEEKISTKKSTPFLFIIHGFIEKRYGHDNLIEAFRNVVKKHPDIKMNILGYGDYKTVIEQKVKDYKLEDNITIFDYLPFDEMLERIKEGDVGLVTMERNPYSELIDTNKMYEYTALKIPVISSRLPVVESRFDDSCFEYFEPGDPVSLEKSMIALYKNSARRKSMAENAFKVFSGIKWGVSKLDYLEIFNEFN